MFFVIVHPPFPFQVDCQVGNSLSQGSGLHAKQKGPKVSDSYCPLKKSKLTGFHVYLGEGKGKRGEMAFEREEVVRA